jgi:YbbR domain-containing protein
VDLGGVRDDSFTAEGELVARTASGNPVDVRLTPSTARATFTIEEVFSQRPMAVAPNIIGNPAPGYTIGNITFDPPVVQVTGPKAIVDSLSGPLALEAIDITGARQRQTATRNIERPQNVLTDRQSVVVVVDIIPIDCSDEGETPCGGSTLFLSPSIEDTPAGLVVEPLAASVQVRVSGPLAQLATIKPEDFRAVISLAGAGSGTTQYTAKVTAPAGIRVDAVEPIAVTLRAAITP